MSELQIKKKTVNEEMLSWACRMLPELETGGRGPRFDPQALWGSLSSARIPACLQHKHTETISELLLVTNLIQLCSVFV
jgi:hypothetical protein